MRPVRIMAAILALLIALPIGAQLSERVDLEAIEKIKAEATLRSQVMEIASGITKAGPRLTNSPNFKVAADYALRQMTLWKLSDPHAETWNFGNGWSNDRFVIKVVSDPTLVLSAFPKAWTPGTAGPVRAELVDGVVRTESDFAKLRGKLRGKFVLIMPSPAARPAAESRVRRLTDAELQALTQPGADQPASALTAAPATASAQAAPAPQPAPSAGPATPPQRAAAAPATSLPQTQQGPANTSILPAAEPGATGFFSWVENALSAPEVTEPGRPAAASASGTTAGSATGGTPRLTRERVTAFYREEGVAAMIEPAQSQGGAVFVVPVTGETDPWKKDPLKPSVPPQLFLADAQYVQLMKTLDQKKVVTLEVDIKNTFHSQDRNALNVMGEIKGTDKADELVMLGAHLDSWHLGTGATDNAAGVAVVMEAMRILRAVGLPMRRTVRLGLWSGEEEGMLGSRAYIGKVFVNTLIQEMRPAHSKLSAYFNLDNGTGAIRGVYMQGNAAITPIFAEWMAPFKSMGMTTLSPRSVTGTDHLAFDNAGFPAFQFIQDPIEYDTRTHHTNLDVYDRLIKDDLAKSAAIMASFVYLTANREELLPRKPLPRNVRPAGSPIP